jgi:hypothetical protein
LYPRLGATSSSTSTTSTAEKSLLQGLTVKELRQRVKEVSSSERGLLSRLKRKQDLIDYLLALQQQQEPSLPTSMAPPLRMAPLVSDDEPYVAQEQQQAKPATEKGPAVSRKEAIFERVYQRYPSLRPSLGTGVSNAPHSYQQQQSIDDIRQWQHPIYSNNNNVTTDMDLVFVGTASCTPGMTRGVSCTALRLHWRRRAAQWNPTLQRVETAENGFAGGTWLFDVGECTQVGSFVCLLRMRTSERKDVLARRERESRHQHHADNTYTAVCKGRKTRCWHQYENVKVVLGIPCFYSSFNKIRMHAVDIYVVGRGGWGRYSQSTRVCLTLEIFPKHFEISRSIPFALFLLFP